MKLSLSFSAIFALGLFGTGCGALGQYGAMMQQPGAGTAGAGAPASAAQATSPTTTPSDSNGATPTTTSSTPSSVSVDIKSSCTKTVKVFYGDKPKFGSGTYSSASANSRSSHSFRPGDQFWIVDETENGLANVQVKDNTREIEILGSCTELAAR